MIGVNLTPWLTDEKLSIEPASDTHGYCE